MSREIQMVVQNKNDVVKSQQAGILKEQTERLIIKDTAFTRTSTNLFTISLRLQIRFWKIRARFGGSGYYKSRMK